MFWGFCVVFYIYLENHWCFFKTNCLLFSTLSDSTDLFHWYINSGLIVFCNRKAFSYFLVTLNVPALFPKIPNWEFNFRAFKRKKFSFNGKRVCFYDTQQFHVCVLLLHLLFLIQFCQFSVWFLRKYRKSIGNRDLWLHWRWILGLHSIGGRS